MKSIVVFVREYSVTKRMIKRSKLFSVIFKEINNEDEIIRFNFSNNFKNSWDWVYQEINRKEENVFYPEDSNASFDYIFRSIPLLIYLDIPNILDNIFRMINSGSFSVFELLENYDYITRSYLLQYVTNIFFIKRFYIAKFISFLRS